MEASILKKWVKFKDYPVLNQKRNWATIEVNDPDNHFCRSGPKRINFLSSLLLLAQATAPAPYSRYQSNSIWAVAKYSQIRDRRPLTQNNDFYVNPGIADLDPHQKAVLSDDVGMAISLGLLDQRHGIIGLADVFQLVSQNFMSLKNNGRHRNMPDFLILLDKPLRGSRLILVECKGTQTNGRHTIQLENACDKQLKNVDSIFGVHEEVPILAFATQLLRGEILRVNISDPPVKINQSPELKKILIENFLALEYSTFQDVMSANKVWQKSRLRGWDTSERRTNERPLTDWRESTLLTLPKTPKSHRPKKLLAKDSIFYEKPVQVHQNSQIIPSRRAKILKNNPEWGVSDALKEYPEFDRFSIENVPDYSSRNEARISTTEVGLTYTGISAILETELSTTD
ncbi:MAG TPA: hypothetical protein VF268_09070 [Gammaproteobacteria bacterium]